MHKRRRVADHEPPAEHEEDGGEGDPEMGKDPPNNKESTGQEAEARLPQGQGDRGGGRATLTRAKTPPIPRSLRE